MSSCSFSHLVLVCLISNISLEMIEEEHVVIPRVVNCTGDDHVGSINQRQLAPSWDPNQIWELRLFEFLFLPSSSSSTIFIFFPLPSHRWYILTPYCHETWHVFFAFRSPPSRASFAITCFHKHTTYPRFLTNDEWLRDADSRSGMWFGGCQHIHLGRSLALSYIPCL